MLSIGVQYGYSGVFAISLLDAASVLLPVPDSLTVFTISGLKSGGVWVYEPLWIATFAGVGSALGEFSGYLLGFGGRRIITKRCEKNMNFLVKSSTSSVRSPSSSSL